MAEVRLEATGGQSIDELARRLEEIAVALCLLEMIVEARDAPDRWTEEDLEWIEAEIDEWTTNNAEVNWD